MQALYNLLQPTSLKEAVSNLEFLASNEEDVADSLAGSLDMHEICERLATALRKML
jgi:hypothetical protein